MSVRFSTLLTGESICNCLYINWLSNKALAKRCQWKVVLADSFPGSNLAMRSISESYRECVRNHACQEGRKSGLSLIGFRKVIWACPRYMAMRVSLCPVPVAEPCLSVSLFCRIFTLCHFRGCLRSYVLMRRQRFRTFDFPCEFRPSWQVNVSVIVCILIA